RDEHRDDHDLRAGAAIEHAGECRLFLPEPGEDLGEGPLPADGRGVGMDRRAGIAVQVRAMPDEHERGHWRCPRFFARRSSRSTRAMWTMPPQPGPRAVTTRSRMYF